MGGSTRNKKTADRSAAFRGGKSGQRRAPHRLTGGVFPDFSGKA